MTPEFETLRPDLSNVRGFNFLPSHAAGARADVESYHSQWRYYDADAVREQLDMLKSIGANMVRVWLSHAVWQAEGQTFLDKWADFVEACEERAIYIMPVLFEHFGLGVEPGADPYNDDLTNWKKYPGTANTTLDWFASEDGETYIQEVVEAAGDSPAIALWETGNAPNPVEGEVKLFIENIADILDGLGQRVTVGFEAVPDFGSIGAAVEAVLARPSVHVISFHPYGLLFENAREWHRMAMNVSKRNGNKPVLATEIGELGKYQPYGQCAEDANRLGFGYLHWQAMCGPSGTNRPFADGSGLFYPDGEVRDVVSLIAWREVAAAQIPPSLVGTITAPAGFVQKTDFTGWSRQTVPPPGLGRVELLEDLKPANWRARTMLTLGNLDGLYQQVTRKLLSLDDALRIKLGLALSQSPRPALITDAQLGLLQSYYTEFAAHDLLTGGTTPYATLAQYDDLFTRWGLLLYQIQEGLRSGSSAVAQMRRMLLALLALVDADPERLIDLMQKGQVPG